MQKHKGINMKSFNNFLIDNIINEAIDYHISNNIPFNECQFRYGSKKYFEYFHELRILYIKNLLEKTLINEDLLDILESDLGTFDYFNNELVPLDFIFEDETKELNKPKRGGPKKFYVYVRDPSTKNIKKVTFGDTTGLSVKYGNPERKKAFAARHKCSQQTDKTSAAYWACRSNKYFGKNSTEKGGYW